MFRGIQQALGGCPKCAQVTSSVRALRTGTLNLAGAFREAKSTQPRFFIGPRECPRSLSFAHSDEKTRTRKVCLQLFHHAAPCPPDSRPDYTERPADRKTYGQTGGLKHRNKPRAPRGHRIRLCHRQSRSTSWSMAVVIVAVTAGVARQSVSQIEKSLGPEDLNFLAARCRVSPAADAGADEEELAAPPPPPPPHNTRGIGRRAKMPWNNRGRIWTSS